MDTPTTLESDGSSDHGALHKSTNKKNFRDFFFFLCSVPGMPVPGTWYIMPVRKYGRFFGDSQDPFFLELCTEF